MSLPEQIVVLSSIDWSTAWQRHQIFASQFAAAGHEVFFVENSGFRDPSFSDLPRLLRRLLHITVPSLRGGTNPVPPGIKLISPKVLPPTRPLFRKLNRTLLVPLLASELNRSGLKPGAMIIAYAPTATILEVLDHLAPSLVVYDCASNFRGHPDAPADLLETERRLLARSALVVCDSDFLYEQKKREHHRVVQVHQGVPEKFFKAEQPEPTYRRLCYYGSWVAGLDANFLKALADAGFQVTVSGFIRGDGEALPSNVRKMGPVRRERLVARLEHFDAVLLPHRITPFMRGVVPAKIYECLAMGRPVIAAPLPSLKAFEGLVYIGETPEEWVRIARELPRTETAELRRRRISLAREHTYENEFARLTAAIEAAQGAAPARSPAVRRSLLAGFLAAFGWIGALYACARALTLGGQVLAGRLLGPVEYGKANLIIAMAAFLQVLPMLGFPVALAKFPAEESDDQARRRLISTALTAFLGWGLVSGAVVAALPLLLRASGLSVPAALWPYAAVLAFLTAIYTVAASPLLGLRRFAARGLAETIYGLTVPLALILFVAARQRGFQALILSLCAALAMASMYSLWSIRGYLRVRFDRDALDRVLGYAALASLNLLTAACVIAPGRLVLHRRFAAREVGIFSAYFTSSAQVTLALLTIIGAVIVPLASRPDDQAMAWIAFRRWRTPLALAYFAAITATSAAGIALFGSQYPLRLSWLATFSAAATLILLHGVIASLYSARDMGGLRVSVTGGLIAAGANVVLSALLIPHWGIAGAAWALIGGYLLGLGYYAVARSEMVESVLA